MNDYLKVLQENVYLKLCILNLIERLDSEKNLKDIQNYLKAIIRDAPQNVAVAEKKKRDLLEFYEREKKANEKE